MRRQAWPSTWTAGFVQRHCHSCVSCWSPACQLRQCKGDHPTGAGALGLLHTYRHMQSLQRIMSQTGSRICHESLDMQNFEGCGVGWSACCASI